MDDPELDEIFDDFSEEDFEDETFGASPSPTASGLDLSGLDDDLFGVTKKK